jgi:hypothetical protein
VALRESMKVLVLPLPTVLLLGLAWIFSLQPKASLSSLATSGAVATRADLARLASQLDTEEGEKHHVLPRGGLSN